MPSAEFTAAAGVTSPVIAIVNGISQVVEAEVEADGTENLEEVKKTATDGEALPPSIPDETFQERACMNDNYSSGQQYLPQGRAEQDNFQGNSERCHSGGGGSMAFNEGKD
jgi:hypothetical protein